jgi:hypothetical protein
MTDKTDEEAMKKPMVEAAKLALEVVSDARKQWIGYRSKVSGLADTVEQGAKAFAGATNDEKDMMHRSAKAAASVAEVLLDFAEAALDSTDPATQTVRRRAAGVVRNVVKLAVDDALDNGSRTVPRTTRMLELVVGDPAWQTIYLPRMPKEPVELALTGQLKAWIDVRCTSGAATLKPNRNPANLELKGIRPSLSLRLGKNTLTVPQAGVITVRWYEGNAGQDEPIKKEIVLSILAVPAAPAK